MDAEPRSLRPFVLITTVFVVMGSVAGYMTWMLANTRRQNAILEGPPPGSLRETPLHPVPFADSVPDMERARLTGLIDAALAGPDGKVVTAAEQEAIVQGTAIVPPALDRLYAVSKAPGFASEEGRQRVRVLNRILRGVQQRVAPGSPPARPSADAPDARADLRARAWFRWWAERSSDDATPR